MTQRSLIPPRLYPGGAALLRLAHAVHPADIPTVAVGLDSEGRVHVLCGEWYRGATDAARAASLEHEAMHIALDDFERAKVIERKDGKLQHDTWNLAFDAAIHAGSLDPEWLKAETGIDPVTHAGLDVPSGNAEATYYRLLKKGGKGHGQGCGRGSEQLPEWVSAEIAASIARSRPGTQRARRTLHHTAQPAQWLKRLLIYAEATAGMDERARSWRRPSSRSPLLPGLSRARQRRCLVLVDCSGSIPDTAIRSACDALAGASWQIEVVLWAVESTGRLPTQRAIGMLKDGTAPGGGTDPTDAAQHRRRGELAIWLTDGEVPHWPEMGRSDIVVLWQSGGVPVPTGVRVVMA